MWHIISHSVVSDYILCFCLSGDWTVLSVRVLKAAQPAAEKFKILCSYVGLFSMQSFINLAKFKKKKK